MIRLFFPLVGPTFGDYIAQLCGNVFCCGVIPLLSFFYITGFTFSSGGYKTLKRMSDDTPVIPVYVDLYEGNRYAHRANPRRGSSSGTRDGAPTTAGALRSSMPRSAMKTIQAFAQTSPLNDHQPAWDPRHSQPEYLVDGTLVGYRYFDRAVDGSLMSVGRGAIYGGDWGEGYNDAHMAPEHGNNAGLYAAYTPDSPVLDGYKDHDVKALVGFSGDVHMGTKGFRAEHGEVIQILDEKPLREGQQPLKFHKDRSKGRF